MAMLVVPLDAEVVVAVPVPELEDEAVSVASVCDTVLWTENC